MMCYDSLDPILTLSDAGKEFLLLAGIFQSLQDIDLLESCRGIGDLTSQKRESLWHCAVRAINF